MIKYWLNNICTIKVASILVISAFGLSTSCTDVNDTTGNGNFLPGNYEIFIDTVHTGFLTKTVKCDSLVTDNLPFAYLGSAVSTRDGQINYSLISQMSPVRVLDDNSEDFPFGKNPIIDSAFIAITLLGSDAYEGEKGEIFTLNVYELKKPLPYDVDSSYYSNFINNEYKRAEYISETPVFSSDIELGNNPSFKLPINDYVKKLLSLKGSEYKDLDKFRDKFPGLYFETTKVSSGKMLMRVFVNEEVAGAIVAPTLVIYYHNDDVKEETFFTTLARNVYDEYGNVHSFNRSFTVIDRDFELRDPNFGIDLGGEYSNGDNNITYFTGAQGVITSLEIKKEVIENIKELVKSKGGSKIIVANATMSLPVGQTDINSLNQAINGIGFYNNYQAIKDQRALLFGDKNYADVTNFIQDYSSYYNSVGIFGGNLNRSTSEYKVNVTNLIQGLVNNVTDDETIEIAPALGNSLIQGVGSIENSPKRGIKLYLTYSVL